MSNKPKWKLGNLIAIWINKNGGLSIKILNWDFFNVPLNPDHNGEVMDNVREESFTSGA